MPRVTITDRYQLTWRLPGEKACVGRGAYPRAYVADLLTEVERLTALGYEVVITPPAPISIDALQPIVDIRAA
jgi:hypothetical protein